MNADHSCVYMISVDTVSQKISVCKEGKATTVSGDEHINKPEIPTAAADKEDLKLKYVERAQKGKKLLLKLLLYCPSLMSFPHISSPVFKVHFSKSYIVLSSPDPRVM